MCIIRKKKEVLIIEYFERKLRLTNLEVWDIQCEEEIYRMFILDENRLPKSTDLNLPTNTVEEDLRKI